MAPDGAEPEPDATMPDPDAESVDAAPADAAVADGDGDGVADADDNCVDADNPDQTDTDDDGLGDACDANPEVADFSLRGGFILFGGLLVDDENTLQGRGHTAHGQSSNGEFTVRGGFRP